MISEYCLWRLGGAYRLQAVIRAAIATINAAAAVQTATIS